MTFKIVPYNHASDPSRGGLSRVWWDSLDSRVVFHVVHDAAGTFGERPQRAGGLKL